MKKICSILLSLVLSVAAFSFVGCKPSVPDTPETLEVYVYEAGYGTQWCKDLLNLFKKKDWVKEKYPNLIIPTPVTNDVSDFAETKLNGGKKGNTFDLMFATNLEYFIGPNGNFLDLTDVVYNSQVPGENVLWKDKSLESYNETNTYIDPTDLSSRRQYLTSWAGGMNSILYNEDLLLKFTDKVPNTTDELLAVCEAVRTNTDKTKYSDNYSFISYSGGSYMENLFEIWWAQYEGVQGFKNFWNGIDGNRYSSDIFKQKGRLYGLQVLEEILDGNRCTKEEEEKGKYPSYVNRDATTLEFMQAQTLFLQGHGLFHCNGDWFENEMSNIRNQIIEREGSIDTFKTMRVPILSKIGVKLGITDAELSAIVDYVDGTTTVEPEFTSTEGLTKQEVIDAVREARTIVHSIGTYHEAGIPVYAEGKEVAVDFLRLMATDEALECYINATKGASLPFKYNLKEKNMTLYNSLGTLQQSRHDYFDTDAYEVYTLPTKRGFPLYRYGGVRPFVRESYYTDLFAKNKVWTAKEVDDSDKVKNYYDETIKTWTDVKWANALRLSGLG